MKTVVRRYRLPIIIICVILSGIAVRVALPPNRHLDKALPTGNFTAVELFSEFAGDPSGAAMRLDGKVVILEGVVAASGKGYVVIGKDMCIVKCIFRKSIYDRQPVLKPGDRITVKGICSGLSMTEVVLTYCILIKKN